MALALCCALETNSLAQDLGFPSPAPDTLARAEEQFPNRVKVVIDTNACGREDDYLRIRAEMAEGNFGSQGEDLIHILVAKLAYIQTHSNPLLFQPPCRAQILRLAGDFQKRQERVALVGEGEDCGLEEHDAIPAGTDSSTQISVKVTMSTQCMAHQVNAAIKAMKKKSKLGSSDLPCIPNLGIAAFLDFIGVHGLSPAFIPGGEWDVNNRELVRLLYLDARFAGRSGGVLEPSTIAYMYTDLLAATGKLSDDSISVLHDCNEPAGDELGTPEDRADRDAWYNDVLDFLGDAFEWSVITYLTYGLGPFGAVALVAVPILLAAAVGSPLDLHLEIRIPETENHRLNIETSKFLTNADSIARLKANNYGTGHLEDEQKEVRDWLMRRLQDIAQNDFQEYNSRPYSRYSLNAILNLSDFAGGAGDEDLALAARIVLDLSAAKFAATSNRGRRIVPFRRVSDEDGDGTRYLYKSSSGADHEIARAMLLSGQTQLLDPEHVPPGPDNKDPLGSYRYKLAVLAEMVNAATSNYRLPSGALEKAVTRQAFEQTIRHTSVERVEQSPAFTISAGGIATGPTAKVLGLELLSSDKDRGDAMPTVIIPTIAGSYMNELFRFDGFGTHHERSGNTCVVPGFACGAGIQVSEAFRACTQFEDVSDGGQMFFVSSVECFPDDLGPHFYLAGRKFNCPAAFCSSGIMDAVEAKLRINANDPGTLTPPKAIPDPDAYDRFKRERRVALGAVTLDGTGRGVYKTAAGHEIVFGIFEPTDLLDANGAIATVVSIEGKPPPDWKTTGGVIEADGQGHATIKGAGEVVIDFSDPMHPSRTVSTPTPSP